ncbi:alpha/beta fold hydrolase [Polymorphospora sp. A560]|uniref:alpha/beta fold hydrolase n=1 Tax=Polymorphospora sp. A560 TaxID=3040203 RepID=UPI00389200C5
MERVEVRNGSVTLSCLDSGSGGDPVVFLHGLAGSARELWPSAAELAPHHRVVAVDQRGHGHSTRRPDDLSRRAYVGDVVHVIEALGVNRPVALVGQSMGGHTAMLVAAWHPDLVRRLVMVEAGVGGGGGDLPARLGAWFASWPVPFRDARAAADFLGTTPMSRSWIRDLEERPDGLWPRFEPDVMRDAIAAVVETARWPEWGKVTAPTLLVSGQRGTVQPEELARMRATRADVTHVVVADAGHDVHLDQHRAWIDVLRAFVG